MTKWFGSVRRLVAALTGTLILLVAIAGSIRQLAAHPSLLAGCAGGHCDSDVQCTAPCVCSCNGVNCGGSCVIEVGLLPEGFLAP
jgi:hypothetical protein